MRQTEKLRGVTRAHLEASTAEHADGTASCGSGTAAFVVGPFSELRVRANRLPGVGGKPDVVDNLHPARVVDEQSHRLSNAAPGLVHRTALRVTATQFAH